MRNPIFKYILFVTNNHFISKRYLDAMDIVSQELNSGIPISNTHGTLKQTCDT